MEIHVGLLIFDIVLLIGTGVCLHIVYNELQEDHSNDDE